MGTRAASPRADGREAHNYEKHEEGGTGGDGEPPEKEKRPPAGGRGRGLTGAAPPTPIV